MLIDFASLLIFFFNISSYLYNKESALTVFYKKTLPEDYSGKACLDF